MDSAYEHRISRRLAIQWWVSLETNAIFKVVDSLFNTNSFSVFMLNHNGIENYSESIVFIQDIATMLSMLSH